MEWYHQLGISLNQTELQHYKQFVLQYLFAKPTGLCDIDVWVFVSYIFPLLDWIDLCTLAQTCRFFYNLCWLHRSNNTLRRQYTVFNSKHSADTLAFFLQARLSSVCIRIADPLLVHSVFVNLTNPPHSGFLTKLRLAGTSLSLEILASLSALSRLEQLEIEHSCRLTDSDLTHAYNETTIADVFLATVQTLRISLCHDAVSSVRWTRLLTSALSRGAASRLCKLNVTVPDWNVGMAVLHAVEARGTLLFQEKLLRLSCHSHDLNPYNGVEIAGVRCGFSGLESLSLTTENSQRSSSSDGAILAAYLLNLLQHHSLTLSKLKRLDISGPVNHSDAVLATLLSCCSSLVNFIADYARSGLGSKTFEALSRIATIKSISLRYVQCIDDTHISILRRLANLSRISLQGSQNAAKPILFLQLLSSQFRSLEKLDVRECPLVAYNDDQMKALVTRCPSLKFLLF